MVCGRVILITVTPMNIILYMVCKHFDVLPTDWNEVSKFEHSTQYDLGFYSLASMFVYAGDCSPVHSHHVKDMT